MGSKSILDSIHQDKLVVFTMVSVLPLMPILKINAKDELIIDSCKFKSLHRKVKPKRYDDYRNQMKLSRKSEEHRHRRNRQMAEAQRLLEDNCISNSPSTSPRRDNQLFEPEEPSSYYSANDVISVSQEERLDIKRHQEIKVAERREFRNARGQNSSDLGDRHFGEVDTAGGNENYDSNQLPIASKIRTRSHIYPDHKKHASKVEEAAQWSSLPSPDFPLTQERLSNERSSTQCPKLRELKERMLKRKRIRRSQINGEQNKQLYNEETPPNVTRQRQKVIAVSGESDVHTEQMQEKYIDEFDAPNEYQTRYDPSENENIEMPTTQLPGTGLTKSKEEEHSHHTLHSQDAKKAIAQIEKDNDDDEASVANIELIYCEHCKKSYAPATYKKFCQTLDEDGVPKCVARNNKRRVYNSAKIRITSNKHLNPDEQRQVISSRKKVVAHIRNKAKGKTKTKRNQLWRQQSDDFRKAMETNRLISKAEKEGRPSHYYL